MLEQTGMAQLEMALGIISKDLDRVQTSLVTYEDLMLKSERVKPELKEVVNSYRAQALELRKEMLAICHLLTTQFKASCILSARQSSFTTAEPPLPPPLPVLPVEEPAPAPVAAEAPAPEPVEEPVQESFPEDDPAAVAELDSDIPV